MLLFLYIYGTNIGICNSGVGKMKHPAFIFVLTKKEVLMVSVELKQEKHNALVSFLMIVIAALFLLYICLLYTSPSPRDRTRSRMPSSA